jgi:hypothetical protein
MTLKRPTGEDELAELVRSIDVQAPPALRARVDEMIAGAPARGRRRAARVVPARALTGAFAGAAALAVLVLALTSGGGSHSTLNLRAAAAPTLLAAVTPAPSHSDHSAFVAASVEGVRFPYWADAFGWRSSGARSDTVAGRRVTTVFYSRGAERIGYAIYAGVPSPAASGGVARRSGGTMYRVLAEPGATVISWARGGHLCVMSSRRASASELIRLAGWGDRSSTA